MGTESTAQLWHEIVRAAPASVLAEQTRIISENPETWNSQFQKAHLGVVLDAKKV